MDKLKGRCGVYKLFNTKTKQFYIGSSRTLYRRRNDHFSAMRRDKHENYLIQECCNKHGVDSFNFKVLEYCDPKEIEEVEQKYLDKFYDNQNKCFNTKPKALNQAGYKMSDAAKKKLSEIKKKQTYIHFKPGKDNPMWGKHGKKHHFYGCKHSQESLQKMSKALTGYKHSKQARENMGKSRWKKVDQFDLDGNFIKRWNSYKEAAEALGIQKNGISYCCSGKRNKAGGYKWKSVD